MTVNQRSDENTELVDLFITSPPYSTAIDYVKMDLPQLLLLQLIENPSELDESMIGSQRKTPDEEERLQEIIKATNFDRNRFHKLPLDARYYILNLKK